jgi:quinol monooxygenase YgiN
MGEWIMAIYMTAQWQCQAGAESVVSDALRQFVAAVKQNEPHTHVYTALQQAENHTAFLTYFIFEDEAARDFHSATDWVKQFTNVIYPLNAAPVIFTEYRLVATTQD